MKVPLLIVSLVLSFSVISQANHGETAKVIQQQLRNLLQTEDLRSVDVIGEGTIIREEVKYSLPCQLITNSYPTYNGPTVINDVFDVGFKVQDRPLYFPMFGVNFSEKYSDYLGTGNVIRDAEQNIQSLDIYGLMGFEVIVVSMKLVDKNFVELTASRESAWDRSLEIHTCRIDRTLIK